MKWQNLMRKIVASWHSITHFCIHSKVKWRFYGANMAIRIRNNETRTHHRSCQPLTLTEKGFIMGKSFQCVAFLVVENEWIFLVPVLPETTGSTTRIEFKFPDGPKHTHTHNTHNIYTQKGIRKLCERCRKIIIHSVLCRFFMSTAVSSRINGTGVLLPQQQQQ